MTQYLVYKHEDGHVDFLDFDVEKIQLSAPSKKYGGTQSCSISYDHDGDSIPLKLKFPTMYSPFPFRRSSWQGTARNYFEFSTNFRGEDFREELGELRAIVELIQEQITTLLYRNSKKWFKGDPRNTRKSEEAMREMVIPLIKSGWSSNQNTMFDDSIPFKCKVLHGVVQSRFYTVGDPPKQIQNLQDVNLCKKNISVVAELSEVWINNHYAMKFNVEQVLIWPDLPTEECTLMV